MGRRQKKQSDDAYLNGAEALGVQLAKLRKEAGWTQDDVSLRLGYASERNISDYEGGSRVIKVWELLSLFEQYGVDPQATLDELRKKRPHGLQYKPSERVSKKKFKDKPRALYIQDFESLVRQSAGSIAELKLLLDAPHRFTSTEYYKLLEALKDPVYYFSLDNLRDAYGCLRADLISIVQHVAKGLPILDQTDRIDKAAEILRAALFDKRKTKPATGGLPLKIVAEKSSVPQEERLRVFHRLIQFLHFNVLLSEEDLSRRYFATENITPQDVKNALGEDIVAVVNRAVIQLN